MKNGVRAAQMIALFSSAISTNMDRLGRSNTAGVFEDRTAVQIQPTSTVGWRHFSSEREGIQSSYLSVSAR